LNLSGCCHSWFNSPKYYITCIVHNKACNINCHSKEDMIICGVFIKRRLHSLCHCPCHRDLYLKLVEFYFCCSGQLFTIISLTGLKKIAQPDNIVYYTKHCCDEVLIVSGKSRFWKCIQRTLETFTQGRNLGRRILPGGPFLGPRNWVYTTCLGHKSMYVSIWVQICQRSHQEWVSCAPDILGWDLNVKLAVIIL